MKNSENLIDRSKFNEFVYNLVLIILGVLIALWVSNIEGCYTKNKELRDYKTLLKQEVSENKTKVKKDITRMEKELDYCDNLLHPIIDKDSVISWLSKIATIPNFDCSHSCEILILEENHNTILLRDQIHYNYLETFIWNDFINEIPFKNENALMGFIKLKQTHNKLRLLKSSLGINLEQYNKYYKQLEKLEQLLTQS